MMRRCLCMALLMCLLCTAALADDFGQTYDDFIDSYAENITAINQSTGRMLLPHSTQRDYDADAKRFYRINGGHLAAEIHPDDSGKVIRTCRITLTAPEGMRYGDKQHSDFTVSAYHSYALLMAMDKAPTAYERYRLVQQAEAALAHEDTWETTVGDYRLTCTRAGSTVTFLFENALYLPSEPIVPAEEEESEDMEENEFLG